MSLDCVHTLAGIRMATRTRFCGRARQHLLGSTTFSTVSLSEPSSDDSRPSAPSPSSSESPSGRATSDICASNAARIVSFSSSGTHSTSSIVWHNADAQRVSLKHVQGQQAVRKDARCNTTQYKKPQHATHTCMVTRNTCYALHLTWHRSMPICSYVFMVKCWFGGRCSSSAPPKLASRVKLLFVNCLHAT